MPDLAARYCCGRDDVLVATNNDDRARSNVRPCAATPVLQKPAKAAGSARRAGPRSSFVLPRSNGCAGHHRAGSPSPMAVSHCAQGGTGTANAPHEIHRSSASGCPDPESGGERSSGVPLSLTLHPGADGRAREAGYRGASLERLIATLADEGVSMLVDTRETAMSRRREFPRRSLGAAHQVVPSRTSGATSSTSWRPSAPRTAARRRRAGRPLR
jgi:hypothetical protein